MSKRRNSFEALVVVDKKREEKENKKMKKSVVKNEVVKVENVEVVEMNKVDMMIDKAIKEIVPKYFDMNETLGDDMVKEFRLVQAKKSRLNNAIRHAIIEGKKEVIMDKYVSSGAINGIIKNYQVITGGLMSDEQIMAIKKLNPTQIHYINQTMKVCLRKITEHNFNKRMSSKTA